MRRDYRIGSIEISDGTVFANCYDILYDEPFKKYLGKPESENAILNAQDLLNDETFSINDEVRAEIEEIFSIKALPGVEEAYEENIEKKDTLLERLNQIDRNNNNAYDLKNLYCSCELNEADKKLVESYIDSPIRLYRFLSTKLEEEFLVEKRPSISDVLKKDYQSGQTRNDKSVTSAKNLPAEKLQYQRFPGGKVSIGGKYYPGSILRVRVKESAGDNWVPYKEYRTKYKDSKILSFKLDENLLEKTVYVQIQEGEDIIVDKVKYKDYLTYKGKNIKLVTKKDYDEYNKHKDDTPKENSAFDGDEVTVNGKTYDKNNIILTVSPVEHSWGGDMANSMSFMEFEQLLKNGKMSNLYKFIGNIDNTIGLVKVEPSEVEEEVTKWFDNIMSKIYPKEWARVIKRREHSKEIERKLKERGVI